MKKKELIRRLKAAGYAVTNAVAFATLLACAEALARTRAGENPEAGTPVLENALGDFLAEPAEPTTGGTPANHTGKMPVLQSEPFPVAFVCPPPVFAVAGSTGMAAPDAPAERLVPPERDAESIVAAARRRMAERLGGNAPVPEPTRDSIRERIAAKLAGLA